MNKLDLAIKISRKVGYYLLQYWGDSGEVEQKSSFSDLVTQHDKNVQNIIISEIKNYFPNDGILAEEGVDERGKNLWIIDPIDGTINFIHGLPSFAVSIAYFEDYKPVFGIVHSPVNNETFVGIKNQGSYLNGLKLKITSKYSLNETVGSVGFSKDFTGLFISKLEDKVRRIRILGSAAISASYVAAGKFDFFVAKKANSWDIAAAYLIVKESGGEIVDFKGKKPNLLDKGSFIFSNPGISNEILKIVKEIGGIK
ncbi:inositol monophosphatase family protein [Thermosipho atlanticus]|uniref:Myo-inositol-1(Or 4)-monophosphatase n=1 Tax=Thermosipho atlanticus DSM 15807 TaxID=1123380 RepID=A0A1M5QU46_9BACT|nr:inositol monophosphatase [Thermosipho atlanticus]SHH17280.1 myo-inositol-1(or 4)-monophosphatase [Thermosipho atlanticus DSM 15807]